MSVKIILLALETLLLFLFLVPLPVICSGNLLGIIVSVMLMIILHQFFFFTGFSVQHYRISYLLYFVYFIALL